MCKGLRLENHTLRNFPKVKFSFTPSPLHTHCSFHLPLSCFSAGSHVFTSPPLGWFSHLLQAQLHSVLLWCLFWKREFVPEQLIEGNNLSLLMCDFLNEEQGVNTEVALVELKLSRNTQNTPHTPLKREASWLHESAVSVCMSDSLPSDFSSPLLLLLTNMHRYSSSNGRHKLQVLR